MTEITGAPRKLYLCSMLTKDRNGKEDLWKCTSHYTIGFVSMKDRLNRTSKNGKYRYTALGAMILPHDKERRRHCIRGEVIKLGYLEEGEMLLGIRSKASPLELTFQEYQSLGRPDKIEERRTYHRAE